MTNTARRVRAHPRLRTCVVALVGALVGVAGAGAALAQPSLTLVDDQTQVGQIGFTFVDTQTFEPSELEEQLVLRAIPRFAGVWKRLSFIPLVPAIGTYPFGPVDMAKDAVRIERFYQRNGFFETQVDWEVVLDTASNRVDVQYLVTEGRPIRINRLTFVAPDSGAAADQFPPDLQPDWFDFRDEVQRITGKRLLASDFFQLRSSLFSWVHNRGYPFATVEASGAIDTSAYAANIVLTLDAGPRARIGEVVIEGETALGRNVLMRELPFQPGDLYSERALLTGQRQLFGLDLVQTALVNMMDDQPPDSLVDVRVFVRDGPTHLLSAESGYLSASGLSGSTQWVHRNFFGGARTLTARATAQTGFGAFVAEPDVLYRASLTLKQPYIVDYRFSVSGSPFAEYRDNFVDESTAFGGSGSLIYTLEPLKTATLRYSFETRDVRSYGFEAFDDSTSFRLIDVFDFLLLGTGRVNRSLLTLSGTYGVVDRPQNPRRGFTLNPSIELAGPSLLSTVEYSRLGLRTNGFLPLGRWVGLRARVTGGWLAPFGKSLPGEERSGFLTLLNLRDAIYFAGGTADVRGWGDNLLGPKLLDLVIREEVDGTDTTAVATANPYYPIGSLTKLSGSLELELPFPGLGPSWGTHLFLDAGRVWTTDERFDFSPGFITGSAYSDNERFFYGAGGGFQLATPIGDVRLSVGYKLNPTFFDLRSPTDIAAGLQRLIETNPEPTDAEVDAAIRAVEPASFNVFGLFSIPESSRLHIHFSIGQTF